MFDSVEGRVLRHLAALVGMGMAGVSMVRAAEPISIEVGLTPIHTVSPYFHGMNFCALWNDTGDDPGAAKAFGQLNQTLVRFPGGVPAEWYDWQHPLGSGFTQLAPEKAWAFAQTSHAKLLFQTNAANDQTALNKATGEKYAFDSSGKHVADLARFAKEKNIGIAYYEIGNEPEMDAPGPAKKSQDAVYAWFNGKFTEQAQAIKAADSKAKIMGPASTNVWFWWHEGDLAKFMAAHGNKKGDGLVDAVSIHWYPEASGDWDKARSAAQGWKGCMDFISGVIKQYDSRPLPLFITEWNFSASDHNDNALRYSNALGTADCIGMFRDTGVAGECFFVLQHADHAWGVLGTRTDALPQNAPTPTYFALAMASRLGADVLRVKCSADAGNVLTAYAGQDKRGGLQLMLINKTGDAQMVAVSIPHGRLPRGKPMLYELVPSAGNVSDRAVKYNHKNFLRPDKDALPGPIEWGPTASDAAGTSSDEHILPPYSISLIEWPAAK